MNYMKTIVDIRENVIYIGDENGGLQEVRREDCLFEPAIGDVVNIFSNDTKTIVQKIEASKVQTDTTSDKVHIHIVNKNESPSYQDLASRQGGRVVNKVIYCVLAFLLGGLGIHKFYAGKIGSGILYLIFCWTFIPGFIALIEFVIALCKPSDSQGNIVV